MNETMLQSALERIADICVQAFQEKPDKVLAEFAVKNAKVELNAENSAAALQKGLSRFGQELTLTCQPADILCRPQYEAALKLSLNKDKKNYYFFAGILPCGCAEVYEFDRCPVDMNGKSYDLLIFIETWASQKKEELVQELSSRLPQAERIRYSGNGTCELLLYRSSSPAEQSVIDDLNGRDYVQLALEIAPCK